MKKQRLDLLVVERGFAESREKAQRLIGAGQVLVNGQLATKSGHQHAVDVKVEVKEASRFVGRGGEKMEAAFENFSLNVDGKVCVDVGSSTGGFTDCMLQHRARKVFAVDVGKGQLHWNLRNDSRVVVMESVNARYLEKSDFDEIPEFATVDVSFISLTKIMPALVGVLAEKSEFITLIKPQFEAGKEKVEKGGVVRDEKVHEEVINILDEIIE